MSKPFRILISGGGITGPTLAYWLTRINAPTRPIQITMIDRASSVLTSGQGIDIEGVAREIVPKMGILETIRSRTTGEKGFKGIDNNNQPYAIFEGGGLTNELEIMRGDLCDVLTDTVRGKKNVRLQYNRHITKMDQGKETVTVTIKERDGESYEEVYDAVVAADGIRSRTRDLMLDPADTKDCVKPVTPYMFCAFFSIPAEPQDASYSRWQHAVNGRSVVIRPVTKTTSSVYLIAVGHHPIFANVLSTRDDKAKRQAWADAFADVKYGEYPRVLREMQVTDNFYSDQIAQVKLPRWYNGRCAVVGDAACCPSVVTGQGTELAMLGAYVLAGELGLNLSDPETAFKNYDARLREYVQKQQGIPVGGLAHRLGNPQTWWGIWLVQTVVWVFAKTNIGRFWPEICGVDFQAAGLQVGRLMILHSHRIETLEELNCMEIYCNRQRAWSLDLLCTYHRLSHLPL